MTIQEIYDEAIKGNYYSLILLIDFLVKEKKVLKLSDSEEKLNYYFQDKFKVAMNNYLEVYNEKRNLETNKKL